MAIPADGLFEAHLGVSDLSRSIAFYRDRLGFVVAHRAEARGAAFLWIGGPGRSMLGLWEGAAAPRTITSHVAFSTDLATVIAAPRLLESAGIPALDFDGRPTREPSVLAWMPAAAIYFQDPDGHLLEYLAMLREPPRPDAGVITWSAWRGNR